MLLNVTVPVRDGARLLAGNASRLSAFLQRHWPGQYELVIAENGSTDGTWETAQRLASELSATRARQLVTAGRGGALRQVWGESRAEVLSYMDVDLSANLEVFPELVNAIVEQGFDLAVGSRRLRPATTVRGWRREWLSHAHNALTRAMLGLPIADAQCGFKVIRNSAARVLLPRVRNDRWFFDTELLTRAVRNGFRVTEIPVKWTENTDSRVRLVRTSLEMLGGIWRLRWGGDNPRNLGAEMAREKGVYDTAKT